jgi:hypothetical protein
VVLGQALGIPGTNRLEGFIAVQAAVLVLVAGQRLVRVGLINRKGRLWVVFLK